MFCCNLVSDSGPDAALLFLCLSVLNESKSFTGAKRLTSNSMKHNKAPFNKVKIPELSQFAFAYQESDES